MGMDNERDFGPDERIQRKDQGHGRDLPRRHDYSGTGMGVGRRRIELPEESPMEVGAWTQRDERRVSMGAVPVPFASSGQASTGPNVYVGCSFEETAGATATVRFKDRNANGPVIRVFKLAANAAVNDYASFGVNINGLYIEVVGNVVGSVHLGAVE